MNRTGYSRSRPLLAGATVLAALVSFSHGANATAAAKKPNKTKAVTKKAKVVAPTTTSTNRSIPSTTNQATVTSTTSAPDLTTTTTTTTTSLAASPTGYAPGPVLFSDNFDDPASGWLPDNSGGWTMGYLDGKFFINASLSAKGHDWPGHAKQPVLNNVRIDIEFTETPLGGFALHCYDSSPQGVVPGSTDQAQTEFLYIGFVAGRGAAVSVGRSLGISRIGPITPFPAGLMKPVNQAIVECKGEPGGPGTVRAWINGAKVADVFVLVMPKGGGVYPVFEALNGLPSAAGVTVDNLVVTKIP